MPSEIAGSSGFVKKMAVILIGSFCLAILVNYFHPDRLSLLPLREKPGLPGSFKNEFIYIDAADAVPEIRKGAAIIIDIRSREDFNAAHPLHAVNIPYHEFGSSYLDAADILPHDAALFLLCEGKLCGMSERVALKLAEYGYDNIRIIKENFSKWMESGLPVE